MRPLRLDEIEPECFARVLSLNVRDGMRRRLLDIGMAQGTTVKCLGRNPSGNLSAYLICGAVIAIRRSDAAQIIVMRETR